MQGTERFPFQLTQETTAVSSGCLWDQPPLLPLTIVITLVEIILLWLKKKSLKFFSAYETIPFRERNLAKGMEMQKLKIQFYSSCIRINAKSTELFLIMKTDLQQLHTVPVARRYY